MTVVAPLPTIRRGPSDLSPDAALRALTYLLEHPAPAGAQRIPARWPWFAARRERPRRLRNSDADRLRALIPRDNGASGDALGDAYQALLGTRGGARRRGGVFYTPAAVASRLVAEVLGPLLKGRDPLTLRVCDPACGSGRFLLAAAGLLAARAGSGLRREIVQRCLLGVDADPIAAELCRFNLARFAGLPRSAVAGVVLTSDAFSAAVPPASFDAVVGNPPFLNQLQTATARTSEARFALAARFPGAVRPYTDTSALFLLRGLELLGPGGRMALIQPQSLLATRDAEPVRRTLAERCAIEGLWTAGPGLFGAQVHVCAPVLRAGPSVRTRIRRWHGAEFAPRPAVPASEITPATWAPLAADSDGLPLLRLESPGTLADLAAATADFRDQYYGLRGCIVEDEALSPAQRRRFPRVVTTGLIDAAACSWGARPCRLLGRSWAAPRADPAALARAGLGPWARARRVPKILLATQTRTLEVVVDSRGELLPVTPLITITARDPADLWRLAAALLSPVLSAWALQRTAGAGLSAGAIKLSAKQTLMLPLPRHRAEWTQAAAIVRQLHDGGGTGAGALLRAGALMCRAYGLPASASTRLLAWYRARLRPRRGPRPL